MLDTIIALFKKKVVALSVTDAEGNLVNFPDVEEGAELKVGDKADGNVTGDVLLADGRTLVMADGVITEIKEKVVVEVETELAWEVLRQCRRDLSQREAPVPVR